MQPPKKGPHTLDSFSEIQISPKEETEVNSLFFIIDAKLPAKVLHHQEKKNEYNQFVLHRVKIYHGSSLFYFYQGMVRTIKMSFLKRKYTEVSATLTPSRKASGSIPH